MKKDHSSDGYGGNAEDGLGMATIDTPSQIWNVRDCNTLAHYRHTPDLEHQGLRHSVDDWDSLCQNFNKSVDGCV